MGTGGHRPHLRDVPLPRRPVHVPHDALHHPLDALTHPFACESRAGLGQTVASADLGATVAERGLDVGDGETSLNVLLVGQDQYGDAVQSLTRDHLLKRSLGLAQPLLIRGIDDVDDTVTLRIVLGRGRKGCWATPRTRRPFWGASREWKVGQGGDAARDSFRVGLLTLGRGWPKPSVHFPGAMPPNSTSASASENHPTAGLMPAGGEGQDSRAGAQTKRVPTRFRSKGRALARSRASVDGKPGGHTTNELQEGHQGEKQG